MDIDLKKFEEVLKQYNCRLEDLIEVSKSKPKAEQDWIYLIHHMHQPDNESDMETLHHCELYEKKNMKGKKYFQKHIKDEKIFQHVLDLKKLDNAPEVVYDHLNNGFKIKIKEINKISWAVIDGLVNVKKTKWSDQDK